MKIWKWYKNLTNEEFEASHDIALEDKYPLYAFTTNKKHRDLWREMRKKEAFIEMKSDITKEEYVEFANKNRMQLLEFIKYKKFVRYNSTRQPELIEVELLTTGFERDTATSMYEQMFDQNTGGAMLDFSFPPMILADKYFKALYSLQYFSHWKVYSNIESAPTEEDIIERMGIELDYSYPEVDADEFSIFVALYSDYLKI